MALIGVLISGLSAKLFISCLSFYSATLVYASAVILSSLLSIFGSVLTGDGNYSDFLV